MPKILLTLSLIILLTFSGCTSCNTKKDEIKTISKTQTNKKPIIENLEDTVIISVNTKTKETLDPFKPSIETQVNQAEVITESLDELEAEAFKTIQPQITKEIQKIPDCLEKAESKEEAFKCSESLRTLNKELAMAMGDFNEEMPTGYDDDFEWSEETKIEMIKEIEASVGAMQEMQTCMEASKTPEELEKCLRP